MVARAPAVQAAEFDVRVFDAEGAPVIAGEITFRPKDRQGSIQEIKDRARAAGFPYALFVDLASTQLFDLSAAPDVPPILELPTRALLDAFSSGIDEKKVQVQYLQRIVESWFRNILSPILRETVPGRDRMEALGILSLIDGGEAEVKLGNYF